MGREHITRANQLHSPLLRLPAELRNKIYEHAVSDITVRVAPTYPPKTWRSKITPLPLALLSTCYQIRHEATGLFYAAITIELATDWDLSGIGADILGLITKLRLNNYYSSRVSCKNYLTSLREVCQAVPRQLGTLGMTEEIRAEFGKPDLEVTFELRQEDED